MGKKSAERIAMHLVFNKADAAILESSLAEASRRVSVCPVCCGISQDGQVCAICSDSSRASSALCLVETAADLVAIEKSGAWRGHYHVLAGKLSPIKNIGPEKLKLKELEARIINSDIKEIVLALSNDVEGEATCYYIHSKIAEPNGIKLTRIGFGLPSGTQLGFADISTIKSALDARRNF